ncbi:MIP18 family protein [Hibiscus syriacus]|uniref:MIP18 family protein n=1 Tax=Hibiscus syriacus TaxID=106335 RepID=A0A6A2YMU4_HIBSY|nr:uncharacterized protein LOC120159727 [Hibiscus syriacus]KAE8680637.1 MIP18 family protein [Hibiscus syriacus]
MNAIRSIRGQLPSVFTPSLQSSLSHHRSSFISFRPTITTSCSSKQPGNMDRKDENPIEKPGDVMSDSFGEGYATRSDEEGFGGTYGGNDSLSDKRTGNEIHSNHPDYDKTQGSEVKEKEKSRHQTHVPN